MRRWIALIALCLAGPSWAGGAGDESAAPALAWVAEYTLHDGQGDRPMILVREESRIEYRVAGEPIRVWKQVADGVEHRQIFPDDGKVVVYVPGDLRVLGREPDWEKLGALVDPGLRTQLDEVGSTRIAGHSATRYRGTDDGAQVELAWLQVPALAARYRHGSGKSRFELTLRKLEQRVADAAFTSTGEYSELDFSDIGDMEKDPFASQHILHGF